MKKLILFLSFVSLSAVIASPCDHTENTFNCVFYKGNYDGDTLKVDIPNVHPILGSDIPIRLIGIDTPELISANQCERVVAELAKKRVEKLLFKAKNISLTSLKRGSFFRIVADVVIDGESLSGILLDEKLAIPYKSTANWCESKPYLKYIK